MVGEYINPDSDMFEEVRNRKDFVDKTGMLEIINSAFGTREKYICFSKPRRFGKTTALFMISAYYGYKNNAKSVFAGLQADVDNKHANAYNVLFINALNFFTRNISVTEAIDRLNQDVLEDFADEYPEIDFSACRDITKACNKVFKYSNKKFVILVDEWDCVFRQNQNDKEKQTEYLDFLRYWLKDQRYVALAYLTGILPIKKYGEHSALNMFTEYSMEDPDILAKYVGFTQDEVAILCNKNDMDLEQCREWYDGYSFKNVGEVYNPWSVLDAMFRKTYGNYWTKTETFEALQIYIKMNYDGLREKVIQLMAGEEIPINTRSFSNDMTNFNGADDVLTLLIHLGYLSYLQEKKVVRIPNNEIRTEFHTAAITSEELSIVGNAVKDAENLLKATHAMEADTVAAAIQNAHLETSHLQYNDENALSYTVSLAYYTAREKYYVFRELPSGKGFADLAFIPRSNHPEVPPMLVELKWDKNAETALDQIKNKEYSERFKGYKGKILLVGICYDRKTRKHECVIEMG